VARRSEDIFMAELSECELEPFGQGAVRRTRFHEFVNAIRELRVFWAIINAAPPGSFRK
jgi:hypothetical protein